MTDIENLEDFIIEHKKTDIEQLLENFEYDLLSLDEETTPVLDSFYNFTTKNYRLFDYCFARQLNYYEVVKGFQRDYPAVFNKWFIYDVSTHHYNLNPKDIHGNKISGEKILLSILDSCFYSSDQLVNTYFEIAYGNKRNIF